MNPLQFDAPQIARPRKPQVAFPKKQPYIQFETTDAPATHRMQAKKATQTRRRNSSLFAPRPGISIALNGSLRGACFSLLLSCVLNRISATAFTAPQKS
jgi:hypothetical protein